MNDLANGATIMANEKGIAIVEDYFLLCHLYSSFLEKNGHQVIFAGFSGEEILTAISNGRLGKDNLDIAILDYHLGHGIDGVETAIRIRELIPSTKIIIVSSDTVIEKDAARNGFLFLAKPFSTASLLSTIAKLSFLTAR